MDRNQATREPNTLKNVQYFYITDRLNAGDISRVIYKPIGDMESNYLTKALQGKVFHTHRKTLMAHGIRWNQQTHVL